MRVALLALLLCSCRPEKLTNLCDTPCAPDGDIARYNTGECRPGVYQCEGDKMTCVGFIGPTREVCDGLDNQCLGKPDEGIVENCQTACGAGKRKCVSGAMTECVGPPPEQEVCNGKDDDCDGIIDNNLPIEFCYTGPTSSVFSGTSICHPGVVACQKGVRVCANQGLPKSENCNGIDDNCNGTIDDGLTGPNVDVVIIFDMSGSMGPPLFNIQNSLIPYLTAYQNNPNLKWALVMAPDPRGAVYREGVHLEQNFDNVNAIIASLNKMAAYGVNDGSSYEPTLDAVWMLSDGSNPLQMTWRNGAKRLLLVLSDEDPQSYNYTPEKTDSDVTTACIATNTEVQVFTDSYTAWTPIANGCGGRTYPSWNNTYVNDIQSILLRSSCN